MESLGFLTFLGSPEKGMFGGYLALSLQGRPLEFRCSTPVQTNRAQAILYGPTLQDYLAGDVIGAALLASRSIQTPIILSDDSSALALAPLRSEPVLHVEDINSIDPDDDPKSGHAVEDDRLANRTLCVGKWRLAAGEPIPNLPRDLAESIEQFAVHIDLLEPFERIRSALTEIQQHTDIDDFELQVRDEAA